MDSMVLRDQAIERFIRGGVYILTSAFTLMVPTLLVLGSPAPAGSADEIPRFNQSANLDVERMIQHVDHPITVAPK